MFGVSVETWSAVGSIATAVGVLAAGVGTWFAYGQLRQAKSTRLDQSRPYVVVSFEIGRTMLGNIDIVVRNVGAGPAHNVRITADPPLKRADRTGHAREPIANARLFNEPFPLMPPGYELRTFFDYIPKRQNEDLPKRYTFTASYDDGHGHDWTEPNVADLALLDDLLYHEVYSAHHVAERLGEIRDLLKRSPLMRG